MVLALAIIETLVLAATPTSSAVYNPEEILGRHGRGVHLPELHTYSLKDDDVERVKALLAKGADPNERDPGTGGCALHYACKHGAIEVAKVLIDAGASVNAQDDTGFSTLMLTCAYRTNDGRTSYAKESRTRVKLARLLIEKGASLKLKRINGMHIGTSGFTALHFAALFDHTNLVRVLLEADPSIANIRDEAENTARDTAVMNGRKRVMAVMDELGVVEHDPRSESVGQAWDTLSSIHGMTADEYADARFGPADRARKAQNMDDYFGAFMTEMYRMAIDRIPDEKGRTKLMDMMDEIERTAKNEREDDEMVEMEEEDATNEWWADVLAKERAAKSEM